MAAAMPQAQANQPKPPKLSPQASITSTLNEEVWTPGTAWMTRPDGKVVVSYDSTVTGTKLTALTRMSPRSSARTSSSRSCPAS